MVGSICKTIKLFISINAAYYPSISSSFLLRESMKHERQGLNWLYLRSDRYLITSWWRSLFHEVFLEDIAFIVSPSLSLKGMILYA